jgi:hypothetical protein
MSFFVVRFMQIQNTNLRFFLIQQNYLFADNFRDIFFVALFVIVRTSFQLSFNVNQTSFLCRYFSVKSAKPRHITMLCHSVFECVCPFSSLYESVVASENLATFILPSSCLISGSLPKLPMSNTLFKPFIKILSDKLQFIEMLRQ